MKTRMLCVLFLLFLLFILPFGCAAPGGTEKTSESPASAASQSPSIEGTYQLKSRQLPDGSIITTPKVMGLFTYTKTHRNFTIVTEDAMGKTFFGLNATYTLSPTEYTQTQLFSVANDATERTRMVYDLEQTTLKAPVKVEGGRIEFKLPGDEPVLTFEGSKLTATAAGEFIDVWERVD